MSSVLIWGHEAVVALSAPRQPRLRSALVVVVMAAEPRPGPLASLRRPAEPLVHTPEAVQSAHIGGIGVVDDAVLAHERAQARPIACVCGGVGSAHGGELCDGLRDRYHVQSVATALVVIIDGPLALLLLLSR